MQYVFGPVPSRRLGLSLGVDIVPFKCCTYDCVYCQLGRTTSKTTERGHYVNMDQVLDDLMRRLSSVTADYITFSGSGEPVLNSDIGRLIQEVKKLTDTPVAVLTNGSLLGDPKVREELLGADLIIPSLDAVSQDVFEKVNRPCSGIKSERVISGLQGLSSEFRGKIWVEVMLIRDLNDANDELRKISSVLRGVDIDKIQLNTVERPPAESFAGPVMREELERIKTLFDDRAELICAHAVRGLSSGESVLSESDAMKARCARILELLERRPCTARDVANGLGFHLNEVSKYLGILREKGQIH